MEVSKTITTASVPDSASGIPSAATQPPRTPGTLPAAASRSYGA